MLNKVVKPHNGPSAVVVLIATGNNVAQDANGFTSFGLNGFSWISFPSPSSLIIHHPTNHLLVVMIFLDIPPSSLLILLPTNHMLTIRLRRW